MANLTGSGKKPKKCGRNSCFLINWEIFGKLIFFDLKKKRINNETLV